MKIFVYLCLLFKFSQSTLDKDIMSHDRFIFFYKILYRVEQPLSFDVCIAQSASLNLNKTSYLAWTEPMEHFYQALERQKLLPQNAFFGALIKSHRSQLLGLYHFLSKTPAWEIFVQNACWARHNTHPHMFVYAMEMAALARWEENLKLMPAIYEILPRHFFDIKFVEDASNFVPSNWTVSILQADPSSREKEPWQWWKIMSFSENRWYPKRITVNENIFDFISHDKLTAWWKPNDYTRNSITSQRERHSVLSYLTEDTDWNNFWYNVNIQYSYPLEGVKKPLLENFDGEYWFYFLEKYLARYYMECLSHGLGSIPDFDWNQAIEEGYDPMLIAQSGTKFRVRPDKWIPDGDTYYIIEVFQTLEYIKSIINVGKFKMRNGTIVHLRQPSSVVYVHNLLRGHRDPNDNYIPSHWYSLAHMYFAGVNNLESVLPHVLLNFETMPRDPFFYIFHKEILQLRRNFDFHLPSYTNDELHIAGVEILDLNISKLMTYDEIFDFDVTNLLQTNSSFNEESANLFARRARLNHRPFTLNMTIKSDKRHEVLLRFYLAPKFDEFGRQLVLEQNRHNFIELTNIKRKLQTGCNILRFAYEDLFGRRNRYPISQSMLYRCAVLESCQFSISKLVEENNHCGLHERLLLPRGWAEGLPMQIFVITTNDTVNRQLWWQPCTHHYGRKSLGFPFDRQIHNKEHFLGGSMLLKDIKIYHEDNFEEIAKNFRNYGEFLNEKRKENNV